MNEKELPAMNKSNSLDSIDYDEDTRKLSYMGDANIEKLRKEIKSDIDVSYFYRAEPQSKSRKNNEQKRRRLPIYF
jgi:hypothetical protein